MKGKNKKYITKSELLLNDEKINENDLINDEWENEQIDIFTDIILSVLIKESLNIIDDE